MRTLFISSLLLSVVLASALQTLNSEQSLKKTGFGSPPPRHGLRLLKWFVKTCLDNNMKALCNPVEREYGFHRFENREKLLPEVKDKKFGYFALGNLNSPSAKCLPLYVRKDFKPQNRLSNMDRVLVKYEQDNQRITEIFISEHYNKSKTYIIGPKLRARLRQLTPHFNIKM